MVSKIAQLIPGQTSTFNPSNFWESKGTPIPAHNGLTLNETMNFLLNMGICQPASRLAMVAFLGSAGNHTPTSTIRSWHFVEESQAWDRPQRPRCNAVAQTFTSNAAIARLKAPSKVERIPPVVKLWAAWLPNHWFLSEN